MFDESRLLAFIRALYQYEKGGCDTCTEHDGYGCSHPGNCEWHWDYAEDLKEFEIPEEVVTMELKKAIEILDGCIPHPSNKMVDREHLDIAIAWSVIKAELSAKPKEDEGEGAGARLFDLICEGLPDYSEGRIWTTYDEIMVKDAETATLRAESPNINGQTMLVAETHYEATPAIAIVMENGAVGTVYCTSRNEKFNVMVVDDNCADDYEQKCYEARQRELDRMLTEKQIFPIG